MNTPPTVKDIAQAIYDGAFESSPGDAAVGMLVTMRYTMSKTLKALHSSKSNEWFTPPEYLERVREALGGHIDLDPASSAEANETVKAERYYTKEDDGLVQPWDAGTVFCNPPYGKVGLQSSQALWSEKFLAECARFGAGILLVNAGIGDKWFVPLWRCWICFPYRRIRFIGGNQPTKGNAFCYIGPSPARFKRAFGGIGRVVAPE